MAATPIYSAQLVLVACASGPACAAGGGVPSGADADNVRLANRLRTRCHELVPFLYHPEVPPTNARAEQEIRPAVVLRKTSACNRAETGAHVHEVLASILRTFRKQAQSSIELTQQRLLDSQASLPVWLTTLLRPPTALSPPPCSSPA